MSLLRSISIIQCAIGFEGRNRHRLSVVSLVGPLDWPGDVCVATR